MMDTLLHDLRYAARALRRAPGFAAIAVLTLALGIGANTTIFSAVDALLLRSLPFPDRDRLVQLGHLLREQREIEWMPAANFLALREGTADVQDLAAYTWWEANLAGRDGAEELMGVQATPDLFAMLGAQPAIGRPCAADEGAAGRDRVVVLSDAIWRRRFAADPGVVGRTVTLNGNAYTVIGVLPPKLAFPPAADVWVPRVFTPEASKSFMVVGKLKPGVSREQAQTRSSELLRRLVADDPAVYSGAGVVVHELYWDQIEYLQTFFGILLAAVGFVLLIACANVANLLLARASVRSREIAVRAALGAGRWRIVRQLLTESVLLALIGGALGAGLAFWAVDLLQNAVPQDLSRFLSGWDAMTVNGWALAFTVAISTLAGVLFGLARALGASHPDLARGLHTRSGSASSRGRLRSALVVAEVALALVLLTGAGLMTRSFVALLRADPGFRADHVLTAKITLPPTEYTEDAQIAALYDRLLERVRALPGARTAGLVTSLPMSRSGDGSDFTIEGRPPATEEEVPRTQWRSITPGYLDVLRIPLLRGRPLGEHDDADASGVALINQTLARKHFADTDPIGQRVRIRAEVREIVGVVGDVRHWGNNEAPPPELYLPAMQQPDREMFLTLRTTGDPTAFVGIVRREIAGLEPDAAIGEIRSMERVVAEFTTPERAMAGMLGAFASIALLIAAIGIYGVIAYAVAQRTHEIGVRMALGADRVDVLHFVLGQGVTLVGAGIALGLAGAFAVTRFMGSVLYGVGPADPLTFGGTALLLTGVALLASYVPARRATRVDPVVALRAE